RSQSRALPTLPSTYRVVGMDTMRPAASPGSRRRAELMARFFRGLDDPTRVLILEVLLSGEKNVTELVELVGSPQGRVSTHLGCLRWSGFVAPPPHGPPPHSP